MAQASLIRTFLMNLNLYRKPSSNGATFGVLTIDGTSPCFTLERPEVQIPTGTYPIELTNSLDLTCDCGPNQTLSHLLPLLDNVPGRSAIRIHSGNWPRDSNGCILVGLQTNPDSNMILQSRAALDSIVPLIQQAVERGEPVTITIS